MEFDPNPKDFDLKTVIGRGCADCAAVSLAWHKPSSQHVAVKRINLEKSDLDFSTILHETLQHKYLCHDHVQPSLASFVYDNEVWIVTPLMGYGSCRDLLHAHFIDGLPETAIAYILRDVLSALEYMHSRGVIHRSVRASHLLISETGHVTLAGLRNSFSMMETGRRARAVYDFPNHYVDSLLWASPELLQQNLGGYDTGTDVYSLGITACELANGIVPFCDMQVTQMLLEKIQGVQPRLLDSSTICNTQEGSDGTMMSSVYSKRSFSSHFHEFVNLSLQPPALRPSASALLQHSFFKQIRRKSQAESLPDLLRPVQPLSQVSLPPDQSDLDDITQSLAQANIDHQHWDFD